MPAVPVMQARPRRAAATPWRSRRWRSTLASGAGSHTPASRTSRHGGCHGGGRAGVASRRPGASATTRGREPRHRGAGLEQQTEGWGPPFTDRRLTTPWPQAPSRVVWPTPPARAEAEGRTSGGRRLVMAASGSGWVSSSGPQPVRELLQSLEGGENGRRVGRNKRRLNWTRTCRSMTAPGPVGSDAICPVRFSFFFFFFRAHLGAGGYSGPQWVSVVSVLGHGRSCMEAGAGAAGAGAAGPYSPRRGLPPPPPPLPWA